MHNRLILSLSSSSLAALAFFSPAQAQAFPAGFPGAFSPGSMGQLDRMCNREGSQTIDATIPGLDNTKTDTKASGENKMKVDCDSALAVYRALGHAGYKAHVDATRALASAQSQTAMIGGIGNIFSGIISAASNRGSADNNAQQQTIATQQRQIEQLKQLILAQQAAHSPQHNQQQAPYNNYTPQPYAQQTAQNAQQNFSYHAPQGALRQTSLF